MEDFFRNLLGNNITAFWLFIIVGICWLFYIPGRQHH
ncbi:hypothetical protein PCC7424_5077 [Gloeothece citriformis PCC 7424]|uniref:Uncharacterized protein n=1 Tax=Gloeothece citriformis (strain PCC 7424) TaxID=65393 RepID=B7KGU1_GLOC7|nr:hypothetical protein PCC7424_5077 [Gloeothece citriformis PCC 7424]